uniref:Photosystem II reaction center protein T n=1 Tax=Alexandrium andersonii TaxID=327968 RepID=A0A7S2ACE4_9DINO
MAVRRPVLTCVLLAVAALCLFCACSSFVAPNRAPTSAGLRSISVVTRGFMGAAGQGGSGGSGPERGAFDTPLYALIAAIVLFSPFVISSFYGGPGTEELGKAI